MMNSEKVKEIKKALGNCQKNNCLDCPYFIDEKRCRANDLLLDTITLINEMESENETFLKSKTMWKRLHTELCKENQTLKDRIAELEKEIKENPSYAKGYAQGIKNTYEVVIPDKLKQFAERLKEKCEYNRKQYCCEATVSFNDTDETLKEFLLCN